MFDITSSKLLILLIVALIVVGPKDLPLLLRTVGKYLGVIRRHADEFRAQFDEAVREAELDQLKRDFETMQKEVNSAITEGSQAVESGIEKAGAEHQPKRPQLASDASAGTAPTETTAGENAAGDSTTGESDAPATSEPESPAFATASANSSQTSSTAPPPDAEQPTPVMPETTAAPHAQSDKTGT